MADHDDVAKVLTKLLQHHAFEVEAALSAHADWKRELRDAVIRGYCELGSEEAGRDDLCALGRWLDSLSPECSADHAFDEVVELHSRFHEEAGAVVGLLETGHIEAARSAMEPDSDFARATDELVCLLEAWQAAA